MASRFPTWPTAPAEPLPLPSGNPMSPTPSIINSFEECVAAGYPVMESYPPQCAVPGGETFTSTLQ